MERQTALVKLRKILGPKGYYREHKNWKSKEEREAAQEQSRALNAEEKRLSEELDRLRQELLSDPVYRNLLAAYKAIKAERQRLTSIMLTKRFTVGTSNALFSVVEAEGDSWEEVLDVLKKKREKKS